MQKDESDNFDDANIAAVRESGQKKTPLKKKCGLW